MLLEATIGMILSLWLGSTEWRLRTMSSSLRRIPSRDDVLDIVDLKQEAVKQRQVDVKEDIQRLEAKIDKLLEMVYK